MFAAVARLVFNSRDAFSERVQPPAHLLNFLPDEVLVMKGV
jgi:hypothetical protein